MGQDEDTTLSQLGTSADKLEQVEGPDISVTSKVDPATWSVDVDSTGHTTGETHTPDVVNESTYRRSSDATEADRYPDDYRPPASFIDVPPSPYTSITVTVHSEPPAALPSSESVREREDVETTPVLRQLQENMMAIAERLDRQEAERQRQEDERLQRDAEHKAELHRLEEDYQQQLIELQKRHENEMEQQRRQYQEAVTLLMNAAKQEATNAARREQLISGAINALASGVLAHLQLAETVFRQVVSSVVNWLRNLN